ncbi:MAG: YdcF family protein [Terriglobia bacterium]
MDLRSWPLRLSRLITRLLAVGGLLVVLATVTPIDNWWIRTLRGEVDYYEGDVLIVLAGSEFSDGTMGWNSYLRSKYAVLYFRPGGFRTVLVSGGPASLPTAFPMADWMRCHGIPAEDIHLETASHSTYQNALYTRDLLQSMAGRKVLLTSDYHMFRARRVFAKMGINVLPLPIPDARKRTSNFLSRWPVFCELGVETAKIGIYWLRGLI